MEFPWRCNVDTIAMDLKVSWEMSAKVYFGAASVFTNRPIVLKPLKNSCSAPGSLDTSLSHAAGLIEIAACHA